MNIPCTRAAKCRRCQRDIYWVKWPASGKRMPVDADPVSNGDIVLTHKREENELWAAKATALEPALLVHRKRYISHFSTCPNASEHRSKS